VQWLTPFYPSGKTSIDSRYNLPGRWAWMAMEAPGFLVVLYMFVTVPREMGIQSLPWGNWVMVTFYVCAAARLHQYFHQSTAHTQNSACSPPIWRECLSSCDLCT